MASSACRSQAAGTNRFHGGRVTLDRPDRISNVRGKPSGDLDHNWAGAVVAQTSKSDWSWLNKLLMHVIVGVGGTVSPERRSHESTVHAGEHGREVVVESERRCGHWDNRVVGISHEREITRSVRSHTIITAPTDSSASDFRPIYRLHLGVGSIAIPGLRRDRTPSSGPSRPVA